MTCFDQIGISSPLFIRGGEGGMSNFILDAQEGRKTCFSNRGTSRQSGAGLWSSFAFSNECSTSLSSESKNAYN